jgi:hypothetical protein
VPSSIALPSSAFSLAEWKSYQRSDTATIDLPLRHGRVVDNNQLHTVKGAMRLSVVVVRLPETTWRKRHKEWRELPPLKVEH